MEIYLKGDTMSKKPIILGIAASLRNARASKGNENLISDLKNVKNEIELTSYLERQGKLHLESFFEAGRKDNLSYDQIYKNLKKLSGNKGLSNSEVALSSSLWSAWSKGCEIKHISLCDFFDNSGKVKNEERLKELLLEADGIILSSPVYFGDRGSLSQSLLEYIKTQDDILQETHNKVFAGIAVGAKRNGGQETALIYQMLDFVNIGFLAVGNDSETTSQYGGTGVAGDVGTMASDEYGLNTAMGTGRRIASIAKGIVGNKENKISEKLNINFLILQEMQGEATALLNSLFKDYHDKVNINIVDVSGKNIKRCIACDICPTHIDIDEKYRCIIPSSKHDDMEEVHSLLQSGDAIIPVVFAGKDQAKIKTNYQKFIERTRYLRRGDYVWTNYLTFPLIVQDINTYDNWQLRLLTSMIRHHTVMAKPQTIFFNESGYLNLNNFKDQLETIFNKVETVAKTRISTYLQTKSQTNYNPVGYSISMAKDLEDNKQNKRDKLIESRVRKATEENNKRISPS